MLEFEIWNLELSQHDHAAVDRERLTGHEARRIAG
jgi:hypothetical protein